MSRYYDYYDRKITVNEGTQEACLMLFTVITSKLVQDVKIFRHAEYESARRD